VTSCAVSYDRGGGDEVTKQTRRRALDADEITTFDHIADPVLERVRLLRTNLLPPAADGMTIGRFVLLRGDRIDHRASALLAHELVHVRQFAEMGAFRFFSAYLGAYVKNLRATKNHRQAYLDIPLEQEARREASQWVAAGASADDGDAPETPAHSL
jgi:hypothetical protein